MVMLSLSYKYLVSDIWSLQYYIKHDWQPYLHFFSKESDAKRGAEWAQRDLESELQTQE